MPKRMIRDWTDSERVNSIHPLAERFLLRLMMKADDFGRYHASPRLLRSLLFPLLIDSVRDADISRWLTECETAGLIVVYEADGKQLLEIVNFGQRLDRATPKFPARPPNSGSFPEAPGSSGKVPAEEEVEVELEGELEIEAEGVDASEADDATQEPLILLVFPVVAEGGGPSEWPLREDKLGEYRETYPGIDPMVEARKALQWIRDNPTNRKTFRGMTKFLNGWMSRAQDGSSKRPSHGSPQSSLFDGLNQSRARRIGNANE